MKKLALITTHPIQYHAPMFKLLAMQCNLKVFYTEGKSPSNGKYDPDFNRTISWDIPLLEGYDYEFLQNVSKTPGSHHFKGIVNPSIINKVEEFNPDVVLVYGWAYKSHLKVFRHFKAKVPIWFRGDSTLLDKQGTIKTILRKVFLRWVYTHVDKALYVGTQNKFYFKAFGLKESQLVSVPHAVDNERFQQDHSAEASELRNSFKIKDDDILILFAGKLEDKKDPFLLLDAFIELQVANYELTEEKLPVERYELRDSAQKPETYNLLRTTYNLKTNFHLLFVGNGALEKSLKLQVESLKQKAESLELNADNDQQPTTNDKRQTNNEQPITNIHFLNFQNQSKMPTIYQACDLFCLPSKGPNETWGLAVNEAMAAGKAVLVSDNVGCARNLVDDDNGAIFKSNCKSSLVNCFKSLLANKDVLKRKGEYSRKKIRTHTFENQVEFIVKPLNG